MTRWFIAGGAGFIGSHVVHRLLRDGVSGIVVYDNFSAGQHWHLASVRDDTRLRILDADLSDTEALISAMEGSEQILHLAANPDIAAAVDDPGIDFWRGTFLTHQVLEAARALGVPRIIYMSGSGVYGDQGTREVDETFAPLLPISTYGASKLAGEALVSSYCHLFGMRGTAFRFANVVGARQTHGIVYDLIRKLRVDPTRLTVLGDGSQSKSYIHVDDVLDAILLLVEDPPEVFDLFNVGTGDYVTVRDIAAMVVAEMGLSDVKIEYGSQPRGWKGDVPVVRFASEKITARGWKRQYSSRQALTASIQALIHEEVESV